MRGRCSELLGLIISCFFVLYSGKGNRIQVGPKKVPDT